MSEGPVYGAIPARAFGDQRFSAGHFRMLGVVAAHDRMSKHRESAGCYAAQTRLASLTGLHVKSTARLISELLEWGYLERSPNPVNGRLAVYRVVFDDADAVAFRGDGRTHTKASRPRPVTPDVTNAGARPVTQYVTDPARSVTSAEQEAERKQCGKPVNIFPERDSNKLGEARSADKTNAGAAEEIECAERAAKAFSAGEVEQRDALDAIRRAAARCRRSGNVVGARQIDAIAAAVIDDALRQRPLDLTARPSPALLASRARMRGAA